MENWIHGQSVDPRMKIWPITSFTFCSAKISGSEALHANLHQMWQTNKDYQAVSALFSTFRRDQA